MVSTTERATSGQGAGRESRAKRQGRIALASGLLAVSCIGCGGRARLRTAPLGGAPARPTITAFAPLQEKNGPTATTAGPPANTLFATRTHTQNGGGHP